MNSTIRSSSQLFIDANLDFKSNKGINLLAGANPGDAVEFSQMNTAIANAVSGTGNAIHVPVANLAEAKTVTSSGRSDKMIMLIETLGLYRFDAEMIVASNDNTVIRPTDVATDAGAGRWIKISTTITDHDNLSNILGNGTYHLSLAERDKLTLIEALADVTDVANVGAAINSSTTDVALVDADFLAIHSSGSLGKTTLLTAKAFFKTYFDTLYNKYIHPNHSGDVTSVADGAITINNNAVTNAKLAVMATMTIKGNNTGASAVPTDLSKAQLLALLNVADGANNYVHPNHTGDVTSIGGGAQTITPGAVTLAKMADLATSTFVGRSTAGTGVPEAMSISAARTLLGLNTNNLSSRVYRATPTGTINGSTTAFTIAANVLSGTEEVFKNGVLMNAGAGNDYTITYGATTTITFATAPSSAGFTDVLLVNYSV